MLVVDDLVGWLVGRLADAGYQRLITLARGSDQARALKQAVEAAVQATVGGIGLSDGEEAERVAEEINKAFRRRDPVPLPPGQPTVLGALQAGIAGQLAVLDDAGQPAVILVGVQVSEVASKLTGYLVREIQIRGSRGGPLADLAGQLNHDVTHMQGQRLEGMLAEVLDWLGGALVPLGGAAGPVGWPLAEMGDPFALEVHRPVEPDVPQLGLPVLPVYVPRGHDAALAEVVAAAAAGKSGIAVLVGGSSTGKTRACWQALEPLRGQEPGWLLWHPIDPQAALAGLPGVGPRTVVWLNEAQRYLDPADGAGARVAAGLRELLRAWARGPVLVLATLWPEFWGQLTAGPPGGADPHAQARELLAGHNIQVPSAFTPAQLLELAAAGDPRLAQAAAEGRDGQVIQYLAGAPELLARYHTAPPAARALIDAAMDGRRLGMRGALPRAFLEAAAPGYLTDTDWDLQPDNWVEQALGYTAKSSKGVRGPLTPIRPRPAPGVPPSPGDAPTWQLADYLDQHGRRARRGLIPPAYFWAAAASYADPADLHNVGEAAGGRGLSRDAARLYKRASGQGHAEAGTSLVRLLHSLHPGDQSPADWAAAHASPDDPKLIWLLYALREAGATGQFTTLATRAAAHASLDDPAAVAVLLDALRGAGATGQVTALLGRDPAAHATLDDPRAVADLLVALRNAGATSQFTALATRAAAHASLDDPGYVAVLLDALREAGATSQVTALLDRDPAAHASLDDPRAVADLLITLREAGATSQFTALATRAAAHTNLDDLWAVASLLITLRGAGATGQVTALATRAVTQARLDDPGAVARLLETLRGAGATGQVTTLLLDRDPAAHASPDEPGAVASLLHELHAAGATGQVTALATRATAHTNLDDLWAVASLLYRLHAAGATGQVTALATRAAAQARLDNPYAVAGLLVALHNAEATGQVTTLAGRAAAHASLHNPDAVARLLVALRNAGATGQVTALLDRDPAAHASLDNPGAVASLLRELRNAEATGQVTMLATRAVAHTHLDNPAAVADLLVALRNAGGTGQVTTLLLDRDPAAHASLDDPGAVASLLRELRETGATGQVAALLDRDPAAHASLDDPAPSGVASLLYALREAGARAQAAELIDRLPAAGMFQLFSEQEGRREKFRFGREADGRPAKPWAWTDLG